MDYPDLITDPAKLAVTKTLFPADAIERAQLYFSKIGSTGAYSHSKGRANLDYPCGVVRDTDDTVL